MALSGNEDPVSATDDQWKGETAAPTSSPTAPTSRADRRSQIDGEPPEVLIRGTDERGASAWGSAVTEWLGFGVVRKINGYEIDASLALWEALRKFDREHAGSSANGFDRQQQVPRRAADDRPPGDDERQGLRRTRGRLEAIAARMARQSSADPPPASDQDVRPEMAKTVVLHLRKQHYLRRRARLQGLCNLFAVLALGCVLATPLLAVADVVAAELAAAYGAIFLLALVVARQRFRELDDDVVQFDQELDRIKVILQDPQRRALKLFQNHSLELRRYYAQVLRHASFIFWVGVACIAVGFALVGATLWLLVDSGRPQSVNQYVLGALGFAAGILANFVAMIYLRMYSTTVDSLGAFHNRLVETHRLHFANFLAAHVDEGLGRETLATMAVTLADQSTDSTRPNGLAVPGHPTRADVGDARVVHPSGGSGGGGVP